MPIEQEKVFQLNKDAMEMMAKSSDTEPPLKKLWEAELILQDLFK